MKKNLILIVLILVTIINVGCNNSKYHFDEPYSDFGKYIVDNSESELDISIGNNETSISIVVEFHEDDIEKT